MPPGETPRLFLDASTALRWVIPIEQADLPPTVSRTARAVQQGGELRFVGKVYGGPEDSYLIETAYPDIAADHLRRLIVAADGRVILRSHSLPRADLPGQLLAEITSMGELETLEFVEGEGPSYYRATIIETGGARRVKSYSQAGELLWETRVLLVHTSVSL